eukprot:614309_1
MADVEVESKSASLVDDWFAVNDDEIAANGVTSSDEDEERFLEPRNLRLGLGAKPASIAQTLSAQADEKLRRRLLKKRNREEIQDSGSESDSSGEEESRTSAFSKKSKKRTVKSPEIVAPAVLQPVAEVKKKKKKKHKKKKTKKSKEEKEEQSVCPPEKVKTSKADIVNSTGEIGSTLSAETSATSHKEIAAAKSATDNTHSHEQQSSFKNNNSKNYGGFSRKRRKTRSRQKNIKRDRRPDHLKPTYLTPGDANYIPPGEGRRNQRRTFREHSGKTARHLVTEGNNFGSTLSG